MESNMASRSGAPAQVAPWTRIGTQRSWPVARAMEWPWGVVSVSHSALWQDSLRQTRRGSRWPRALACGTALAVLQWHAQHIELFQCNTWPIS